MRLIKNCLFVSIPIFITVFGNGWIILLSSLSSWCIVLNVLRELKNSIHSCLGCKILHSISVQGYQFCYSNLSAHFCLLDLVASERSMLNSLTAVLDVSLFPHSTCQLLLYSLWDCIIKHTYIHDPYSVLIYCSFTVFNFLLFFFSLRTQFNDHILAYWYDLGARIPHGKTNKEFSNKVGSPLTKNPYNGWKRN